MGPSIPLRRESPTTATLLSFMAEEVTRLGSDCLALGFLLGRSSIASPFLSPSDFRVSNLLLRWIRGRGLGRHGGAPVMLSWDSLPTLLISQVCLTVTGQGVNHFSGGICLAAFPRGCQQVTPPAHLPITLPDGKL